MSVAVPPQAGQHPDPPARLRGSRPCRYGAGDLAACFPEGKGIDLMGALSRVAADNLEHVPDCGIQHRPGLLVPEHDPGRSGLVPEKEGGNPALLPVSPVEFLWLGLVDNFPEKEKRLDFAESPLIFTCSRPSSPTTIIAAVGSSTRSPQSSIFASTRCSNSSLVMRSSTSA